MKSFKSISPSTSTSTINGDGDILINNGNNKSSSFMPYNNHLINCDPIISLVNNKNNSFCYYKRKPAAQLQSNGKGSNQYEQNARNNHENEEDNFIKRKKIKISRTSSPLSTSSNSSSISSQSSSLLLNTRYSSSSPSYENNTPTPVINIKISSSYNISFSKCNDTDRADNIKLIKTDNDHIKLKSNYLNNFFSNFKNYVIEKMPFDICLLSNENKKLNAHKIMLINASNYFKQKLSSFDSNYVGGTIDANKPIDVLEMKQLNSFECLEICIKFIYTGGSQLDIFNLDLIDELKITATFLELNDLVSLCDLIISNIETKNTILNKNKPIYNNGFSNLFEVNEINNDKINSVSNNSKLFFHLLNSVNNYNNGNNLWQYSKDLFNPSLNILNNLLQMVNNKNQLNDRSIKQNDSKNDISNDPKSEQQNEFRFSDLKLNQQINDENRLKKMLNYKLEHYQKVNSEGHDLFDLLDVSKNVRDYFYELLSTSINMNKSKIDLDLEIDTLNRDLVIKNKYIYPIMFSNILNDTKKTDLEKQLLINNQLNDCFENYSYINLFNNCSYLLMNLKNNNAGDFHKPSLIVFSLSIGQNSHFRFNNFLIQDKLNFTDLNVLKDDLEKCLDTFLNDYLIKKLNLKSNSAVFRSNINNVFYLKKPSNCKTIKLEEIKSSTDCFRALVEYSRLNSFNEKPYVLVTIKANVSLSMNPK